MLQVRHSVYPINHGSNQMLKSCACCQHVRIRLIWVLILRQ